MDIYIKNLHNFIASFKNNLYNEYNKNEILSTKLSNYKKVYDNNLLKKILVQTDNLILKGIDKLHNSYTLKKYNKKISENIKNNLNRDHYDKFVMNRFNSKLNQSDKLMINNSNNLKINADHFDKLIINTSNSKDLTLYKNTLINNLKYLYYKFKDWFLSKDKFYVEYNLIRNLNNLDNFTEDGLSDYYLIENINNIINIRNIENPEDFIFEFEITLLDKTNKISNKICKIKIDKDNQKLKISEISCNDI